MVAENGEWVMHGLDWDNPYGIRSYQELINWINEVGFLPLFKNEIEGFSAEEHTSSRFWWTGDREQDPWEWRKIIARTGTVAYGKFFNKKAGFISKKWFPYFANYRRQGYDFDSRWEDELASIRCKKIMDQFEQQKELYSFELKKAAGFGKNGEKNFEGIVTELQMQTYLIQRDFRRKMNKRGEEYGGQCRYILRRRVCGDMMWFLRRIKKNQRSQEIRFFDSLRKIFPLPPGKQF